MFLSIKKRRQPPNVQEAVVLMGIGVGACCTPVGREVCSEERVLEYSCILSSLCLFRGDWQDLASEEVLFLALVLTFLLTQVLNGSNCLAHLFELLGTNEVVGIVPQPFHSHKL